MEPASSSDESSVEEAPTRKISPINDDNDSSSDDYDSSDDSDGEEQDGTISHDFDDLPSDDSCMESDSDDDGDGNGNNYNDEELEEVEEDIPLVDRMDARRTNGMTSSRSAKFTADKKSAALALTQKRLAEMKKKREEKRSAGHNDSFFDDDGKGGNDSSDSDDGYGDGRPPAKKKKSRHEPAVASSSRAAYFERGAPDLNQSGIGVNIGANKYTARDPRMQTLSGYFDQNVFERRYEFLDKMQDDEINKLKDKCKAWKMTGKKAQKLRKKLGMTEGGKSVSTAEDDKSELDRLLQERATRRNTKMSRAAKSAVKKKIKDDVAAGKQGAYYLKKRDMRKLEMEAKFDSLKKSGGDSAVTKAIAKRRKKKMGKDSGLMPSRS
jgi:ribosomal RNA-processing protein 36